MPLFDGGPGISYKLEHLAQEHGIDAGDAHDAIADCNLSLIHISEPTRLLSISYAVYEFHQELESHLNKADLLHLVL